MSKKKQAKPKTKQLKIHLTEHEYRLLKIAVALGNVTTAEFMKSAVLNHAKQITKNLNLPT